MREVFSLCSGDDDVSMDASPTDDVDDTGVVGCLPRLLDPLHSGEIRAMVAAIAEVVQSGVQWRAETNFARYLKLLEIYEEQPTFLDSIVPELMENILSCIKLPAEGESPRRLDETSTTAMHYLFHLMAVRGYKVIVRLLPHHVSYLEMVLSCLEQYSHPVSSDLKERRMLLLWLWIVCKNPFDLRRFDPIDQQGLTMRRIFAVAMPYFDAYQNSSQYAAALVISQCLARADGVSLISDVVYATLEKITPENENIHGYLSLLLAMQKHVDRIHILPMLDRIVSSLSSFYPVASSDVLVRKFLVKLAQRVSLVLLKPRVAAWRYRRGKRRLEENLMSATVPVAAGINGSDGNGQASGCPNGNVLHSVAINEDSGIEEEDDENIPELVEWSLEIVLSALSDEDTSVRWSGAKGVGRIAARLPRDFASQVVEQIMSSQFHRLSGHSSWHGGCMALAELSRRGFLLPEYLPSVFPVVQEALFYEEPMGRNSLGSNVRDAACYVLWAFARAYEPVELRPYLNKVATSLICVALFDRQVNLRRAASAAFQENVGRQANFPDGIPLLTIADYFAVGNRENCYSKVAIEVVKFPAYSDALVDHLVDKKISHWDGVVREQAARSLRLLATLHSAYITTKLPLLLEGCMDKNTVRRHGSLLALSHAIKGLRDIECSLTPQFLFDVAELPNKLLAESQKLKSAGGEQTRMALVEFIHVLSLAQLPLNTDQVISWHSRLEACATDDTARLRDKAAACAREFFPVYFQTEESLRLLEGSQALYRKMISAPSRENQMIGICGLITGFPSSAVSDELYTSMCELILCPGVHDKMWARARTSAVGAVTALYGASRKLSWVGPCFETLFKALEDYTQDNTGDIGRLVREKSMICLTDLLITSPSDDDTLVQFVPLSVGRMVQQSCEKIGRTRECACKCIMRLLCAPHTRKHIASPAELEAVYFDSHSFIQDKTLLSTGVLLNNEDYFLDALHGLVLSAGGVSAVTTSNATKAILEYQNAISLDLQALERFISAVATFFSSGMKVPRIGDGVLRFVPQLLSRIPSNAAFVDGSKSLARIIIMLKNIAKSGRASPGRIRLSLEGFSALLSSNKDSCHGRTAISIMVNSLSNPTPTIRRKAAEALYDALCLSDEDEEVLKLLSETVWQDTSDTKSVLVAAGQIEQMLSVA